MILVHIGCCSPKLERHFGESHCANLVWTDLETVIETDFVLALNAVKYLETERDKVVTRLLEEIPKRVGARSTLDHRIEAAVEFALPISACHEQPLRDILKLGSMVGAAAAACHL
jgi:hypothetical protein